MTYELRLRTGDQTDQGVIHDHGTWLMMLTTLVLLKDKK